MVSVAAMAWLLPTKTAISTDIIIIIKFEMNNLLLIVKGLHLFGVAAALGKGSGLRKIFVMAFFIKIIISYDHRKDINKR